MRHHADDTRGRLRKPCEPVASHPGLQLQVDAHAVGNLVVRDRELEIGVARVRDVATRRGRAHDEDANTAVFAAEREPLLHRGDAERARAGSERRARDVDGAVSVAVCLDDGPQLRAAELADERAHVSPQRAEVNRDLRAMHINPDEVRLGYRRAMTTSSGAAHGRRVGRRRQSRHRRRA